MKRDMELVRKILLAMEAEPSGRMAKTPVIEGYTETRLRVILMASAVVAVVAYAVWAFELPAVHGIPWRPLTIIPFALCIGRYGALISRGRGEAPEDVLLSDRLLQVAGVLWLLLFALGVHAAD